MPYKRFLKTILFIGLLAPTITPTVSAEDYSVTQRISGNNRVKTSIEASKKFYAAGSTPNVVLAGYNGEVDALTGTLLASSMNAPLLLVDQFKHIEDELIRLGAKSVYLLGGNNAINQSIEKDLQVAGYEVSRIAGKNRLETAVAIANEAVGSSDQVFLTNDGRTGSLVDALAIGPVSGMYLSPIMLTSKNQLPAETLTALNAMGVDTVNIIGGSNVVSKAVENVLIEEGFQVDRISGENRWQTAEKIADLYFSPGAALIANDGFDNSLVDALVGGHIGAKMHIPLLLTSTHSLNNYTEKYLLRSPHLRYVLGGQTVVSDETFKDILKTEGEIVSIDTEEEIQVAKYNFEHHDGLPINKESIAEFARNGKSITTYKSVLVDGEVIENIRVRSKWKNYLKNGLIYIGTGKDLSDNVNPILSYDELFNQSGWIIDDFTYQEGQIKGFSETGKSKAENEFKGLILVLPEKDKAGRVIHTIGKEAFKDFYFQRAKIPETITVIQESAFENVNLIYTEFPQKIERIESKAFSGNGFSNRVHFNSLNSLTEIGDEAFNFAFSDNSYALNLESLSSLKHIGKGTFVGNNIKSVKLPEGLISIGSDAFIYNLIDQVSLPSSLKEIDEFAFDENVILIENPSF